MNVTDKAVSSDVTLGQPLDGLAALPEAPLVFLYEGQPVKAGYHLTEVKAGALSALDCGANPEAWADVFIQLWDIDEDGRGHMPAGKFSAIIRKVSDHVRLDPAANSPSRSATEAVHRRSIAPIRRASLKICKVSLTARLARSMPRDRCMVMQPTRKLPAIARQQAA